MFPRRYRNEIPIHSAIVTHKNVRRPPQCGVPDDYSTENGFRIRKNRPELTRLLQDYKSTVVDGNAIRPYHIALSALCQHSSMTAMGKIFSSKEHYNKLSESEKYPVRYFRLWFALKHIIRPLSMTHLNRAYIVAQTEMTSITILQPYQRERLLSKCGLVAPLIIALSIENGHNIPCAEYTKPYTHFYCMIMSYIGRRVSGGLVCAEKIAAPYIEPIGNIPSTNALTSYKKKYENIITNNPEKNYGIEFKKEFKLLFRQPKWKQFYRDVERVHRGEMSLLELVSQPWVYQLRHTFMKTVQGYLTYIEHSRLNSVNEPKCPRFVKTTRCVQDMFRFIMYTDCIISEKLINVFGLNKRFINKIIERTHGLATQDGSEMSALVFGYFVPYMMTPDIHLDINVTSKFFQHPLLYVKMSDPIFGKLKKRFRDVIPSRHNGYIARE